jgi:hypothetical protein
VHEVGAVEVLYFKLGAKGVSQLGSLGEALGQQLGSGLARGVWVVS